MALLYDALGNVIGDDGDVLGDQPSSWGGENFDAAQRGNEVLTSAKLGYIESKIAQFQQTLYDLDETAADVAELMLYTDDPAVLADLQHQLGQYENQKTAFKFAAEAFNGTSSVVNSLGGNMAELVIPEGLGILPAVPIAWMAAITGAIVLIDWAHQWISVTYNVAIAAAEKISDADARNAQLTKLSNKAQAAEASNGSMFGNITTVVKWGAIAYLAYLGYQAYKDQ